MKPSRISSDIFLRAAELQFIYRYDLSSFSSFEICYPYSCNNLKQAVKEDTNSGFFTERCNEFILYYSEHFKPVDQEKDDIWWGSSPKDNESRILALLLCHEMLKSCK